MAFEQLSDESLRSLYESVREQVSADIRLGSKHRLMRTTAKDYAERLREEIDRRRLKVNPIGWE
jgi:hypothetical protein